MKTLALRDYLPGTRRYLADGRTEACKPDAADVAGFDKFLEDYRAGYGIERAAVESLK